MTTWHLDPAVIDAYADGSLDDPRAYSAEAHLTGCADCRALVADAFDAARVDELWTGIVAEIDAPLATGRERLLRRLGVAEHTARLLAATPALSLTWIGAVAVALGFAVAAVHLVDSERSLLVFLGFAPLVPVVGVATAYGPGVDPTHELAASTPIDGWRLLGLRAVAVLGASIVLAGLGALTLPGLGWTAVAWLLPALGGTLATVALSTFVGPRWAGAIVGSLWLTVVTVTARVAEAPLSLFEAPTQGLSLLVALLALAVTIARRGAFDTLR